MRCQMDFHVDIWQNQYNIVKLKKKKKKQSVSNIKFKKKSSYVFLKI